MNTKQKIIEALEGKRTERVWELIEKSVKKLYEEKFEIPIETKEEYLMNNIAINDKDVRYVVFEYYSLEDGFYGKFLGDYGEDISQVADEYFSYEESDGGYEIMVIDMKEMKSYLLEKSIKYNTKEIKVK